MIFSRATPPLISSSSQSTSLVDSASLVKGGIVCVAICLSITTVVFILRTWARLGVLKQRTLEDYMCCISYIGLVVYFAFLTVALNKFGGLQKRDLTSQEAHSANYYWSYATSIEYAPAMLCTKLTVLLLYRRVLIPLRWSVSDIILRMFMVVCSLYYITTIAVRAWECTPRAKIWNKSTKGTCISTAGFINTDGVFNTLSDILILLAPIKALWVLQMKAQRKIGIVLLFAVGLIAPISSIIGWIIRTRNSTSPDSTYHDPTVLFWEGAELSAVLACVCLPTFPTLLHRQPRSSPSRTPEGHSHPRHLRTFARKQPSNISDQESLHRGYSDFGDGFSQGEAIEAPPKAVVTAIEGGSPRGIRDIGPVNLEAKDDEFIQRPAIMKTVVVEQSSDDAREAIQSAQGIVRS